MTDDMEKDIPADSEDPKDEAVNEAAGAGEAASPSEDAASAAVQVADPEGEAALDSEAPPEDESKVVNEDDADEGDAEAAMLEMLEGLPEEPGKATPDDINFSSASASRADFQQLQEMSGEQEHRNIDLLMDVDLPVSIELGRTKMPISDILGLGPGSVVELNKLAGEPVDLLVNYKVVAKGEVVVVDENFGLRITQLMTPEERLKALAEQ
jgi:flagellar motor switch protein FliN